MIKCRFQGILLILWSVVKQLHVYRVPSRWTRNGRRQFLKHIWDESVRIIFKFIWLDGCEKYIVKMCENNHYLLPSCLPRPFFSCFAITYSIKTGMHRVLFCEWIVAATNPCNIYYKFTKWSFFICSKKTRCCDRSDITTL